MKLWVDAQLSPAIAWWLRQTLGLDAHSLKELGLRDAEDEEIFLAARSSHAIVMTKDQDFAYLVRRNGPPPQIIWIRSGNTSNVRLKEILSKQWSMVASILEAGEPLVEVVDLGG